MSDFLDYIDEMYEELVDEFGHEIESNCIHEQTNNYYYSNLFIPARNMVYQGANKRKKKI